MSKSDVIEVEGKVVEKLPNAMSSGTGTHQRKVTYELH